MLRTPLDRSDQTYNRDEVKGMAILYRNPNTLFSLIPEELIVQTKYFLDLLDALKEAAYAKLAELKIRLEQAKKNNVLLEVLLTQKDDVITPAGLTVKNTTLLGFAICAGDPEMAEMIKHYFSHLKDGEKKLNAQLNYYGTCVEEIATQTHDDLTWLMKILIESKHEDVLEELKTGENYNWNHQSKLRDALNQFRNNKLDSKNRIITQPKMHCNYQNLIHAYEILDTNWNQLNVNNSYDKHDLFARQVIGFSHLTELTGLDRQLFAQGEVEDAAAGKSTSRSFKYRYSNGSFPDFDQSSINSHVGIGFNFFVSIYGIAAGGAGAGRRGALVWGLHAFAYKTYIKQKLQTYRTYAAHTNDTHRVYNSLT